MQDRLGDRAERGEFLELSAPVTVGGRTTWTVHDSFTGTVVGTITELEGHIKWDITFAPEMLSPNTAGEALEQMRSVWKRYRAGKRAEEAGGKAQQ